MIRYYFLIGVFVIVISSLGCAANSSSEQIISESQKTTATKTPPPPPTSTATETPSPTSVAAPTYPPPTPTLPTTSTPIPPLIWSDEIKQVRVFDLLAGKWSPVENSLVLHNCFGDRGNNKRIVRVDAPDFSEIKMSSDDYNCYEYFDMAWTPDGQEIVYTGPPPKDYPNPDRFGTLDVWLMGRNGEDAHLINPGEIISGLYSSSFEIIGWADNNTVVFRDQNGNFTIGAMLDITTGEYYSWLATEEVGLARHIQNIYLLVPLVVSLHGL